MFERFTRGRGLSAGEMKPRRVSQSINRGMILVLSPPLVRPIA
jgi:hypothetical protein